jgi:hypothetical protein
VDRNELRWWLANILLALWVIVLMVLLTGTRHAHAHDIYTGFVGKGGHVCCGARDCSATVYRERGDSFEFLTREGHWVHVPEERITWLPIPGDPPSNDSHHAHLCYRETSDPEYNSERVVSGDGQSIYLYCAVIPPRGT